MTTKKSQVRDVFTSAKEYYQALEFTTEEPQYAPMVHEFEAGLEVLNSLFDDEDNLLGDGARLAVRESLAQLRYDVKAAFPLQARFACSAGPPCRVLMARR